MNLHLDVDDAQITPQSRLTEDLCVDSLSRVDLLIVLEDEFDIALPENEVGDLNTFADLVSAVTGQLPSRP